MKDLAILCKYLLSEFFLRLAFKSWNLCGVNLNINLILK